LEQFLAKPAALGPSDSRAFLAAVQITAVLLKASSNVIVEWPAEPNVDRPVSVPLIGSGVGKGGVVEWEEVGWEKVTVCLKSVE